ncbi:transposase InsO family protein [Streptomyces canus]|uniref:Transposase InsO family protein n=1 Tax=Streptomyces canus TaxID=58343 RepID=A0AAW8FKY6_9ACTN|nr:IS3 family transposase [Streptomyces canus]MDQ0910452.1 transposase InsO family protein [Streptomyces canus]
MNEQSQEGVRGREVGGLIECEREELQRLRRQDAEKLKRIKELEMNAVREAFNGALKVEYVHRHTVAARAEARVKIATWIAGFCNTRRLHSIRGFKSPIDYEHEYRTGLALRAAA